jgi:L-2,4-diaminobutyrate transaminase
MSSDRESDRETVQDRAHVFHPGTHLADFAGGAAPSHLITRGRGIHVVDADGRELIDGFAGLWCVDVGYGRTEIADAVHRQMTTLNYYHTYHGASNEPAIRLSQRLAEMIGMGMNHVFYGMSGSDANETNVKIVWYYNNVLGRPQKKKIIARQRSYHGSGLMTGSLTGQPGFHALFDLPLPPVRHVAAPHFWRDAAPGESERAYAARLARELEETILAEDPATVAAFIAEPVVGSGGILPPPEGYWDAVQEVLRRHDVLLIADEVVTGFGRTGAAFGSHLYGIRPDLMAIAKGLTSGYLPLSGVVVGDRVWEVLLDGTRRNGPFVHGWTYSAHPVCAAAANANLDIIEREGLVANARDNGAHLQRALAEAVGDHPMVGEIRGVGLLAAVEFVAAREPRRFFDPADRIGARVTARARDRGLIVRTMPASDGIGLAPPLTVTRADVDRIVGIVAAAIADVHAEL